MAGKEATPQGVSNGTPGEEESKVEIKPHYADRLSKMEEIAASADAEKIQSVKDQGGELIIEDPHADEAPPEGDDEPVEPPAEEETPPAEEPEEEAPPAETPPAEDEEMVTIKVDGKETQVPLSKVVDAGQRTLQKETAADSRLEEATRILQGAKQTAAQLSPAQPGVETPPPEETGDTGLDPLKEDLKAKRKAYEDAVDFGSDEDTTAAAEAMDEAQRQVILAEIGRQQPTQQEAPPGQRFLTEQDLKNKEIKDKFEGQIDDGGFADVAANPRAYHEAFAEVNRMVANGEGSFTDYATYEAAGKKARGAMESRALAVLGLTEKPTQPVIPPSQQTSELEARRKKKEGIKDVPTASAAQPPPEQEVEKTEDQARSEGVADIRKARGQQ